VSLPNKNKFDPAFPITDKDGRPTQLFRDYVTKLDLMLATIAVNAANDAAAAAAGVPVGSFYRNGSVIQVRVV
jgi:hypothetical protein